MGMGHISIVWVADGAGAHISRVLLNMQFSGTSRPEHVFFRTNFGNGTACGPRLRGWRQCRRYTLASIASCDPQRMSKSQHSFETFIFRPQMAGKKKENVDRNLWAFSTALAPRKLAKKHQIEPLPPHSISPLSLLYYASLLQMFFQSTLFLTFHPEQRLSSQKRRFFYYVRYVINVHQPNTHAHSARDMCVVVEYGALCCSWNPTLLCAKSAALSTRHTREQQHCWRFARKGPTLHSPF